MNSNAWAFQRREASLVKRNDEMVKEIQRLRSLNKDLQRLLSKFLQRDLLISNKKVLDIGVQTESSHSTFSTPVLIRRMKDSGGEITTSTQSKGALGEASSTQSSNEMFKEESSAFWSSSPEEIDQVFLSPKFSRDFPLPTAENDENKAPLLSDWNRPVRSVRKRVSYRLTPLNVKIRKGFKWGMADK